MKALDLTEIIDLLLFQIIGRELLMIEVLCDYDDIEFEDTKVLTLRIQSELNKRREEASRLASLIADYFRNDHQLIWGIHHKPRKSGEYHVHYLVNAVNYRNGKMIHSYKTDVLDFAKYIHEVMRCGVRYSMMGYEDDLK